jgi:hypothetical protein
MFKSTFSLAEEGKIILPSENRFFEIENFE